MSVAYSIHLLQDYYEGLEIIHTFSTDKIFPTLISSREISTGLIALSVVEDLSAAPASDVTLSGRHKLYNI